MTKVSNADRRLPMEERAHVVDDGRLAIPGFRRGSVGYGCNRPPSAVPTLRSDLATGAGDDVPPLPSPPLFPTSPAMNAPNPPLRAAVMPVTASHPTCTLLWCTETTKAPSVDPGAHLDNRTTAVSKTGVAAE